MPNAAGHPVVFISYSHDTPEHKDAVLALSQRLREDGIDARIDQYVKGTPEEKWPRWMLNQIDDAKYGLVICTPTYYRRFRGKDAPGKGKGADWEGAVITQEIYDSNSKTKKFIPVFLSTISEKDVPEPLRGHTYYCLKDDEGFKALCDALWDQAGVEPVPLGKPRIAASTQPAPTQATVQLVALSSPATTQQAPSAPPQSPPTSPVPQAPAHPQTPMHRRSDQAFVAHAKKEMADVLERCQALKNEIDQRFAAKDAQSNDLVATLEQLQELETVVNDYLRSPTIACLRGLAQDSEDFRHRWASARAVLAWLTVLSVRSEWIEEFERKGNYLGFQVEIAVSSALGVEIVSSRYRQHAAALPKDARRADLRSMDCFNTPLMPPSYDLQQQLDALLLHIWERVFPEDSRKRLSKQDIRDLNNELRIRAANRTKHHYFAFSPEDDTPLNNKLFLNALLNALPHLAIFQMSTATASCPLLVADESLLLAVIRSFLEIPQDLQGGRI